MRNLRENIFNPKACLQIGIWVNVALTAFKFLAGIWGRSYAMVADAFHSFSDILATSIAYIGVAIGAWPEDEDHPYGHGNAETIAAALISLIILGLSVFVGVSAVRAILKGQFKEPLAIALWAAAVSIVAKEALYRYTIKVGNMSNNPAVIADAWHHRSDAYSSVAALIGIGAAKISFLYLDPLAGIVVSVFIAGVALRLIRSNVGIIMDEKPQQTFINKVSAIVQKNEGVKKIDSIKVHRRGSRFTIDIEIAVDSKITVEQGHKIAANVRTNLLEKVQNTREVMVHVNPAPSKNAS